MLAALSDLPDRVSSEELIERILFIKLIESRLLETREVSNDQVMQLLSDVQTAKVGQINPECMTASTYDEQTTWQYTTMTINEKQDEIVDEFESLEEDMKTMGFDMSERIMQKTNYIMDLGEKLPQMPESDKTDENRIFGCQSIVWLTAHVDGDKLYFSGAGSEEARISKGIISLLLRVLSGNRPEDIANADLYFVDKIGMKSFITSRRTGGLASMIERMKAYGRAYSANSVQ